MPEGRAPISSSRIATGDIARHSFAVVRRGFDTDEVRSYLQSVSRSIEAFEEREQELRAAVAEAEERAAHPVVDEATLTASLGQHSAQILRHAHEEAARIVAQAQEGAATLLRETQSQVDELQARTEASSAERVVEVELLVANAEQEARVESERLLAEAVADGEAVIARAKDEGRTLLEQVQEARRRVLADLASRRRALGIQIEQLRAARDEMAASVLGVRDKVDGILTHLERTDDEARAAAMAVGDQFRLRGSEEGPHDQDSVDEATGETPAPPLGDVGTAGGPGEDDAGASAVTPSVDELFARIRAGTDAAGGPTEPAAPPKAPAEATAGEAGARRRASEAEAAEARAEAAPGPDDELVARRDEALAPVTARLGRTVKRALGDDQNRLLDRLRNAPSVTADELLGPEDEHMAAFAAAARSHLAEAFTAGAAFGGAGAATVADDDAVEQSVEGLAHVIVAMLRRQMADGDDELSDRVGAAFREWRGERVERLTGDYATQAFSAGVTAAAGDDKVRWVVTSASGCSDCEDNALAGAMSARETFPTGHAHPPAHSGCRCLVAPADD
ncbi:MAG: DivIVA domain-containing protein [Acidimicrobiales bacterium]|jgi:DivIVA domain-containing protein